MDQEDAFMSLFFSNIHASLLQQWEAFVVEQSAKFRSQHSARSTRFGRLL